MPEYAAEKPGTGTAFGKSGKNTAICFIKSTSIAILRKTLFYDIIIRNFKSDLFSEARERETENYGSFL